MGMMDGLLGGIVGAGVVTAVNSILEKHGGLQGVVNEFERNGLGATGGVDVGRSCGHAGHLVGRPWDMAAGSQPP